MSQHTNQTRTWTRIVTSCVAVLIALGAVTAVHGWGGSPIRNSVTIHRPLALPGRVLEPILAWYPRGTRLGLQFIYR